MNRRLKESGGVSARPPPKGKTAVDWLVASGIVNRCTQVSDGATPLKSFKNASSFKLYIADTGLLACAYGAQPTDLDGKDRRTARFRGGIAENYVMQQLSAQGATAYYWGIQSIPLYAACLIAE